MKVIKTNPELQEQLKAVQAKIEAQGFDNNGNPTDREYSQSLEVEKEALLTQIDITPASEVVYPEMGQKPTGAIEYSAGHGGSYYITTDLQLKGQGITQRGDGKDHVRGKKTYYVTEKAFEKLKKQHTTSYIASL